MRTYKITYSTGTSRHDVRTYSCTVDAPGITSASRQADRIAEKADGVVIRIELTSPRFH